MSITLLKNKINKSLEGMDEKYLQSAYQILKELANQQKYANINIDKDMVDLKVSRGIQQLDNEEGTDFRMFLNEMQASYGNKI